jgi:hypothetical protein
VDGQAMLRRALGRTGVVEVWIDRETGRVEQVLPPPPEPPYRGLPVPVF